MTLINQHLDDNIDPLIDNAVNQLSWINDLLAGIPFKITNALEELLFPALKPVIDFINGGFTNVQSIIAGIGGQISTGLENVFTSLAWFVPNNLWNINNTLDKFKDIVEGYTTDVFPEIDLSLGAIQQGLLDLGTITIRELGSQLDLEFESLKTINQARIEELSTEIYDLGPRITTEIAEEQRAINETLDAELTDFTENVQTGFIDLHGILDSGIGNIDTQIASALDVLSDALDPTNGTMLQIGSFIMDKFTDLLSFNIDDFDKMQQQMRERQIEAIRTNVLKGIGE